ncbi:Cof subfamily protein (haloacid dehalogenase superfamily) [Lachnospiraceae bacterium PF1-21]
MKKNIKLVAFDLDGTLLTDDKQITEATWEALKELAKREVLLVPCTGRPLSGIPEELVQFPGIRYLISANGARVVDVKEKKVLREELIPVPLAERVLKIFYKYDCLRELYYDGEGVVGQAGYDRVAQYHRSPAVVQYFLGSRQPVPDLWDKFYQENRPVDKVQGVFREISEKARAYEELAQIPEIAITTSLVNNLEINLKDVTKGSVLCEFAEGLGIARDEIMAFGDGDNDLEMIAMVGTGVAMENGIPELREKADYVTVTNNEDGVAKVLVQQLLMEG